MFGKENLKKTERVVKSAMGDANNALRLTGDVTRLREELETLKIEKARKDEEFAKKEREIEHKVGLERKRQEFEIEQAKRETSVTVREENLSADRKRFEEQLEFHQTRFETEVKYLHEMAEKLMERLPSADILVPRRACNYWCAGWSLLVCGPSVPRPATGDFSARRSSISARRW